MLLKLLYFFGILSLEGKCRFTAYEPEIPEELDY